jgi:uncharacterized membrane protein
LKELLSISLTPRISLVFISIFLKMLGTVSSVIALAFRIPSLAIVTTTDCLFWFLLLFVAAVPATDKFLDRNTKWLGNLAKISVSTLVITGILEILLTVSIGLGVFNESSAGLQNLLVSFNQIGSYSDATALESQATDNFLNGKNPYREANIIAAGIEFNVPYIKVTPLRTGCFETDFPYPDLNDIKTVYIDAQATPEVIPPEFALKYDYPAASFILPAPFIALGIRNLNIVFLLFLLPALGYVIWQAKTNSLRICFIIALFASLWLWSDVVSAATSLLVFPLLLMAWLLRRKNIWLSVMFMGTAIATKQIAWFLFPFYLILVLREKGFAKAASVAVAAVGIFLAFNLAYIVQDPGLWLNSTIQPATNNLFPSNVGIIALNYIGTINIRSSLPFTIVEAAVFLGALIWYFFNARRYPETALVLAVLPFFFAWRGSWGYLNYFDLIVLAAILLFKQQEQNGKDVANTGNEASP